MSAGGAGAPTKRVNLALQGGGAHGAFTWGVLDRLLEADEQLKPLGASALPALIGRSSRRPPAARRR